jgi:hypothetical protein
MDKKVLEIVNRVLALLRPGLKLPDTIKDLNTLDEQVALIIQLLGSGGDTTSSNSSGGDAADIPDAVAMNLRQMRAGVARLAGQVRSLKGNTKAKPSSDDGWLALHQAGILTLDQIARQAARLGR